MQTRFRWWIALMSTLVLLGCREFEVPLTAHSSTSDVRRFQVGLMCGLDRSLSWPITDLEAYAQGTVMAGFFTYFFPGAQPFPCDRVRSYRSQGTMMFTGEVPQGVAVNTVVAQLEISAFAPSVPIDVTEARPVAVAVSGGYSGETRHSCRFRIKSYPRSTYIPEPENYGGPWVTTHDLADPNSVVFVPLATAPRLINVTEEFRRSIYGNRIVMRLAIEPEDHAMISGAQNLCYGQFSVRLRLLAPDA